MNTLLNDSMAILQQIHFLRANWFFVFIPLFIYIFLYVTKTSDSKNWQSIVDPQLQNFVLEKTGGKRSTYPVFLIFIAASLCITALAGPVYKKLPQPVYQEQSALVVLFDLSQSMNATDVKPSRLARAKLELLDVLKTRKSGQTAFIVYAADAFTVTPLTNDNATIANLIPSLETSMMPAQGSNLSKGLTKAFSLLTQAGVIHGNILVISDDIHPRDETAIKKLVSQGHRLSIFGIGTTQGSPVPIGGGFLLDKNGAIVIPKLHPEKLQNFALTGGGLYTGLAAGDQDTLKLTRLFQSKQQSKKASMADYNGNNNSDINADVWQEEGHWLLLPLLLFAALWARKGWIAIVIFFILPIPQPAYAQQAYSIDTDNLWSSEDQKAMRAFNKGKIAEAAKQFNNQQWKASALYKNGDYQAAVDTLKGSDTSNAYYNKGNALAKLGNYEAAIKAYNEAIELDAKNSDAVHNREKVKQALKKQQNSSQNNDSSNKKEEEKSDSEKQQSQDKDSKKQDGENKDSESDDENSKNEKTSDEQQSKPSKKENDSENKQNEEELKKRNAQQEAEKQKEEQEQFKQDQKNAKKDQAKNNTEHKDESEDEETPKEIEINPEETSITEAEKAAKQWLKRIPDDPGGLLKRKFLYQYNQLPNQTDEQEPW